MMVSCPIAVVFVGMSRLVVSCDLVRIQTMDPFRCHILTKFP